MEAIILEANLQDLAPPIVVKNPFKDKRKKRSFLSGGEWRSSVKAGDKYQQQPAAGKVQLILRKTTESASSALDAPSSSSSTSSSYWLRFLNVTIRNEKDLPAFVVLCRASAREFANEKQLKQLEGNAETVLLDDGPEGQWKGCHLPATFDQELVVFDPLGFASVMICKPSAAKPPSILPLVFAYGAFQSYSPPVKTPEQIALEMEALSNKLLNTVMEIEQDELQNQLSLDELQRNAKQLFKMFDQDKSNSIDFGEYQQMLAYRKLNVLESKAKRFFQLVDDQKKGYIDEREFVVAMYITNHLRVHAATKSGKSSKAAASAAAPNVALPWPRCTKYAVQLAHPGFVEESLAEPSRELGALPVEIGEVRDLQVLDLHSNQLHAIPDQIKHLHYLKVLNLAYNQLQTFGECCDGLHALEELNLCSNRLESLSESIGSLSALQILLLRGNPSLKVFPSALQRLGDLIAWDFSACGQKRIGKDVFGPSLSNLRALTLPHNTLSSLPNGIGQVKRLQSFNVKDNLLMSFPAQLCELTELVVLNAKSNKLAHLPQEIGCLLALESLFLSSNKLSELPPTIGLLVNLRQLDLQSNRLQKVPMEMGALVKLEELNLSWNEITELPEEIGCLVSLRTVNLSHNRISHLPDAIVLWQSLETLSCSHNWLATPLTPSLRELQALRYIDLSQNQLTQLESCIYKLENLEVLDLASNHITFLPKEMMAATCMRLRKLDLYNNRLVALPVEMAELLPRLDVLSIERNPMKYLPEKWSNHWRLENQYKTAFAKGYTQAEVKEWVHDQSICYPVILGGSDAFVETVQLVMESDHSWQPGFQRIVRHYFYEFRHLGHAVVYDDISFEERAENAAVESELHELHQRRATDAIDENNAFRAHIECSYRVDLDQVMVAAFETRKLHKQKLLAELREETHQLNEIVGEKLSASLVAREERFRRQRAQFAIEMKRAAREKQDQRLARKAEMQQIEPGGDGRQEYENR
ncbi:Phosphatidylinositol-3-phosphate5-kinase, partial [Globisporangium splendens]